jgi:hypothetical protein
MEMMTRLNLQSRLAILRKRMNKRKMTMTNHRDGLDMKMTKTKKKRKRRKTTLVLNGEKRK